MDRLDVAPDGDLILVVSDELELLVHACVLRLTSPVFKAMLGPDFTEGQNRGTAANPQRLSLPEDDITGMRLLCLVLHQANEKLPGTISSNQLLRFAVAVDKYHCTSAIALTTQAWLSAFQGLTQIDDATLCAAYLLDDAKSFKRMTGTIIRKSFKLRSRSLERKNLEAKTLIELGQLGARILDAMKDQAECIDSKLNDLTSICAEEISGLLRDIHGHYEDYAPNDSLEDSDIYDPKDYPPKCGYLKNIVQAHLCALAHAGIWPRSSRNKRFDKVLQAVEAFELVDDRSVMWCDTCGWDKVLEEIKPAVDTLKEKVARLNVSLCLDCLKRGGKSAEGQECRVEHK